MCKGLAIIVEKTGNDWIVHAKVGESSHDKLLHELSDELKYGKKPHLKFEVLFPNRIQDDIQQDVEYPEGFIEIKIGKKVACKESFKAVSDYYYNHPELNEFTSKMLSHADLSHADLSHANLSGADLFGADLSHANLSGADLSGANLLHADLSGADLSGANLLHANLLHADLSHANLLHADLSHANLLYADLSGADLSHANLLHADLSHANLLYADLSHANLSGADLLHAKYNKYTIFPEGFVKFNDFNLTFS